jgi:glyoxalase family protein
MSSTSGLHHITAISGPAQQNLDFYVGVLGMRLVKKSVNQDEPGTYHLFYADAAGNPGTDLTFFPWPRMAPARMGHGLAVEVGLEAPHGSLEFYADRLQRAGTIPSGIENRFGRRALPFTDPHGLRLALLEGEEKPRHPFEPWDGSPIEPELQIRGLGGARLWEHTLEPTISFLTEVMGFHSVGSENGWHRLAVGEGGPGEHLELREAPGTSRGAWGTGGVHHLAFRVADESQQGELRRKVEEAGRRPTEVIDRFWFRSVYFLEPGGVLFELATDGPGFAVDEDPAHLGESLVLPPWLEADRPAIESVLPVLAPPRAATLG